MRLAERAIAHRSAVMPLLRQLAPQAADSDLASACGEVVGAIMRYELSSEMSREEPLETKLKDLRRMKKAFQNCLDLLEPDVGRYGALRRMQDAQLNQKGKKGRVSELKRQLASATDAVDASLQYLQAQPKHGADENQAELAARLRWTLAKTLGLRPVMKPDGLLISVDPGASANYSRLLRLALTLAGRVPPQDLQHIMERGRKRLRMQGITLTEQHVSDDYPDGVAVLGYGKLDT